jgi:hypothetical protein
MNNWHGSLRKVKMQQWKEREKRFSDIVRQKRACIFLAIRYCKKCTGESNAGKEKQKRVNCKN